MWEEVETILPLDYSAKGSFSRACGYIEATLSYCKPHPLQEGSGLAASDKLSPKNAIIEQHS